MGFPAWYPAAILAAEARFEDFQAWLHQIHDGSCPRPCNAMQGSPEPTPAPTLEPTPAQVGQWVLGERGADCVSTCYAQGKVCNADIMRDLISAETLTLEMQSVGVNCVASVSVPATYCPFYDSDRGHCYYNRNRGPYPVKNSQCGTPGFRYTRL